MPTRKPTIGLQGPATVDSGKSLKTRPLFDLNEGAYLPFDPAKEREHAQQIADVLSNPEVPEVIKGEINETLCRMFRWADVTKRADFLEAFWQAACETMVTMPNGGGMQYAHASKSYTGVLKLVREVLDLQDCPRDEVRLQGQIDNIRSVRRREHLRLVHSAK
jgi:hypothetical protein